MVSPVVSVVVVVSSELEWLFVVMLVWLGAVMMAVGVSVHTVQMTHHE